MSRDRIPLYDGALQANRVGSFVKGRRTFDVIRPGYDAQGRQRLTWTQVVHQGVPVFEVKVRGPLNAALDRFDALWTRAFGGRDDAPLVAQALAATMKERRTKFRDGKTGETPAPSISRDGRGTGPAYLS